MGAMDIALEALLFEQEQALQGCTTRSDAVQLSQLLSDDFFEFGASGNVWGSKAEIMTGLLDEGFCARSMTGFAVNVLGEGVALVTYRGYREGVGHSLRSSVWREEAGQWRMVFHQGTPVAVV